MSDVVRVAGRLAAVRTRLAAAAERVGRAPGDVVLVGVSKRHGAAQIADAVAAGLTDLAESYVQEATAKLPEVARILRERGLGMPRLHFVGRLQRNKARVVVPDFDVVQSLDRIALGDELDRRATSAGRHLDVLLQVDLSGEPQKGGVAPEEIPALLAAGTRWKALRITGLMAIPAPTPDPESMRPAFARLSALGSSHGLPELSMGMSEDFEVAIEEGATIIRVGTAIFGPRDAVPSRGTA